MCDVAHTSVEAMLYAIACSLTLRESQESSVASTGWSSSTINSIRFESARFFENKQGVLTICLGRLYMLRRDQTEQLTQS